MSVDTVRPRLPQGAPASAGGQFTRLVRSEAEAVLAPRHTQLAGYDLRGFTAVRPGVWSATIFRDGHAAIAITVHGGERPMELTELAAGDQVGEFLNAAASIIPGDFDGEEFADTLRISAEVDRLARAEALTRADVIETMIFSGELGEHHRYLLA